MQTNLSDGLNLPPGAVLRHFGGENILYVEVFAPAPTSLAGSIRLCEVIRGYKAAFKDEKSGSRQILRAIYSENLIYRLIFQKIYIIGLAF